VNTEVFDIIWNEYILKFCESGLVPKITEAYQEHVITIDHKVRKKAFNLFCKAIEITKKLYMDNNSRALDRHKISACLLYSIIKADPLEINKAGIINTQENETILLANEYLAFYAALRCMKSINEKDDNNSNNDNVEEELILPISMNHKSYAELVCIDLYYSKIQGTFNILAYSNILFLLEQYSNVVKQLPAEKREALIINRM
jgi:hypothetical protein